VVNITEGDDKSQLYIMHLADHGSFVSADIGKTFPISYTFPNWDAAAALSYRDTAQIFLSQLLIDMKTCARDPSATYPELNAFGVESMISKAIEPADRVCQSPEYFFEDNKRMIGRMVILAPFEAARGLYKGICLSGTGNAEVDEGLSERVRFYEAITERIRAGGMPIWGG
jgi:hypothetical protein